MLHLEINVSCLVIILFVDRWLVWWMLCPFCTLPPCSVKVLFPLLPSFTLFLSLVPCALFVSFVSITLWLCSDQHSVRPLPNDSYAGCVATTHAPSSANSSDRWWRNPLLLWFVCLSPNDTLCWVLGHNACTKLRKLIWQVMKEPICAYCGLLFFYSSPTILCAGSLATTHAPSSANSSDGWWKGTHPVLSVV